MVENKNITQQLEQAIIKGQFQPGDRLPAERMLAADYSTSRNRIREAIKRLETLGLLRTEPQSGTFVRDYLKEASYDLLIYLLEHHGTSNPDIFTAMMQVRHIIESTAVSTVTAGSLHVDFSQQLQIISNEMRDIGFSDMDALLEHDYRFHNTLVRGAGNIIFDTIFRTSKNVHTYYTRLFYRQENILTETLNQHSSLIQAMKAGNTASAVEALDEMLKYGTEQVAQIAGVMTSHTID